jgi:Tfp pilus assembly protein PilZ
LKLHLPDGGEEVEVDGKVVWTNQYGKETQDLRRGMGVKFLNLQPEVQKRIQTYIDSQQNRNLRLER